MVCDGISQGMAFARAGFKSAHGSAPSNLWALPRIQARAQAILEARRTTGVVTLEEVTDMLKRVFAGAHTEGEYSAAHNAAFSLARLYGHVTDKASLEIIRRPSRDPDAPSEQALASWVETLPGLPGPCPEPLPIASQAISQAPGPEPLPIASQAISQAPPHRAPAELLENNPKSFSFYKDLASQGPEPSSPEPSSPASPEREYPNDINWLDGPGQPENGAPSSPVTGTPTAGARTEVLEPPGPPPPGQTKRVPLKRRKVPIKKRGKRPRVPSAKVLFG